MRIIIKDINLVATEPKFTEEALIIMLLWKTDLFYLFITVGKL